MDHPQLARTPIAEALLEFRFSSELEPTDDQIREFASKLRPGDWQIERRDEVTRTFRIGKGGPDIAVEGDGAARLSAFLVRSADKSRVIQIGKKFISVDHLQPYGGWGSLCADIAPIYRAFVDRFRPSATSQIASRFINLIDLPEGTIDLDEHFKCAPRSPSEDSLLITDFSQVTHLWDQESEVAANTTFRPHVENGKATGKMLFDISASKSGSFGTDFEALAEAIEQVHRVKNDCFFGFLTELTLEKYR